MKKTFAGMTFLTALLIVALLIFAGFFAVKPVSAEGEGTADLKYYNQLKTFLDAYPQRTAGAKLGDGMYQEYAAAEYIKAEFLRYGYDQNNVYIDQFAFSVTNSNTSYDSQNVVAYKKSDLDPATEKVVIIHAKYDNVASMTASNNSSAAVGGTGAFAGGTGLISLLGTAERLAGEALPYNVLFVASGASEYGGRGIKHLLSGGYYADGVKKELLNKNVLLAAEFNHIAGGDELYAYSEDVETLHNSLIYDTAKGLGLELAEVPAYRRLATNTYMEELPYNYYHAGFSGDSSFFLARGVNTVMYESFNWSDTATGLPSESKGSKNVIYTSDDTLEVMVNRLGGPGRGEAEISKRIDTAITSLTETLKADGFAGIMERSMTEKDDYSFWMSDAAGYIKMGVVAAIVLAIIIGIYFMVKSYRKKLPPVTLENLFGDNGQPPEDTPEPPKNIFEGFDF